MTSPWIMRGVLGLDRTKPAWFDLPVMMKLTLSTPFSRILPRDRLLDRTTS